MDFSNENWHFLWFFKNYHLPIGYIWKSVNYKTARIMDYTLWNALINFQESISTLFIQISKDSIKANHFLWSELLKIGSKKSSKTEFSPSKETRWALPVILAWAQTGTWVWRPNSCQIRGERASAPIKTVFFLKLKTSDCQTLWFLGFDTS